MLNFFRKDTHPELDFMPEIAMYQIQEEAEKKELIHIRFASGDENQINKNFRVSAQALKSIELKVVGFEKFECLPSHPSVKFIDFKSIIIIERFDMPTEEILLAEHRVAIEGQYERIKKTNGKTSRELTWMTLGEAEQEIKETMQDCFSDALDGYLNLGKESQAAPLSHEKKTVKKFFSINNIINFALISVIIYTVIVFAYGKLKNDPKPNFQTQNTVLETLTPEEINKQVDDSDPAQSADDLAMQEFGLEPGVNLNH